MSEKKYILLDGTNGKELDTIHTFINKDCKQLYRIQSVKSFKLINGEHVSVGDFGGYIESELHLSQSGRCWVDGTSVVAMNGRVYDDALVRFNSYLYKNEVCGDEIVANTNSTMDRSKHEYLEKLNPPTEEIQQKNKNFEMSSKIDKNDKTTTKTFMTSDETLDNTLKSFTGKSEVYVVKKFNL